MKPRSVPRIAPELIRKPTSFDFWNTIRRKTSFYLWNSILYIEALSCFIFVKTSKYYAALIFGLASAR